MKDISPISIEVKALQFVTAKAVRCKSIRLKEESAISRVCNFGQSSIWKEVTKRPIEEPSEIRERDGWLKIWHSIEASSLHEF